MPVDTILPVGAFPEPSVLTSFDGLKEKLANNRSLVSKGIPSLVLLNNLMKLLGIPVLHAIFLLREGCLPVVDIHVPLRRFILKCHIMRELAPCSLLTKPGFEIRAKNRPWVFACSGCLLFNFLASD